MVRTRLTFAAGILTGARSAPEGEEFPGAREAGGQPGQRSATAKILAAGLEIFPGMRNTVDRAMWGREKSVGIFSELYSHPFMKLTVVMYCC